MAVPVRDLHRVQRKFFLPEMRHILHVRRAEQPSVETIGPGMVRALDAAAEIAGVVGAQTRAAVPADVVKGAQYGRLTIA